ncbi:MAG TPA: glycosyltransferase family 39 protein, partial [bacterium]|nr:glycosyltransferase family 39 protein [bacterium]
MMTDKRDYTDRPVLGSSSLLWWTLLLALALRLVGIWHGLPYAYQIDEKYVVNHAVGFGTGDLNPHNFHWPGTTIMYLLFVEYGVLFVFGWLIRVFPSPESFAELFIINPTIFYLVGRVTIAFLGTANVFLGYEIGRRFYSAKVGYVAAFFMAVSSLLTGVDHMVLPDTLLVFLGLMTLLLSHGMMQKGDMKYYLLSGLCI